jgi:hypothetical protein
MSLQSPRTLLTERDKQVADTSILSINLWLKYDINIDYILNEVIRFNKTKCNSIANKYNNPNNLKKHSTLSFDCTYSIDLENLGLGGGYPYTKTLELVEQNYSDNLIWK